MKCDLGSVAIVYDGNKASLKEFGGHGIATFNFDGSRCDCGIPIREMETLISRHGGSAIIPGMVIVHTPELCAEGIKRSADEEYIESDKTIDALLMRLGTIQKTAEKRTKQVLDLQNALMKRD